MRINVSEAYREEFEVLISKYQKLCDRIIDNALIYELNTCAYCGRRHPDVMQRLTGAVSSSDIMRGVVNQCSITNITPLKEVTQHCYKTRGIEMIEDYQHSLDEYLSKLRARYLLGSSKDIVNAEEIILILDWTPDEASFPNIKRLLYKAFGPLNKKIILVQDTGKKILHLYIYHNDYCIMYYEKCSHTHTHTRVSISLLVYVV